MLELYKVAWCLMHKLDSPHIKRDLMSSIRIFIYELPNELPNKLPDILKLWKYLESLKFGQRYSLVSILPFIKKCLALTVKNYAKTYLKVFWSFCGFFRFCLIFFRRLVWETLNNNRYIRPFLLWILLRFQQKVIYLIFLAPNY